MEMEIRLYICPFKRRVTLDILNRIRYRVYENYARMGLFKDRS